MTKKRASLEKILSGEIESMLVSLDGPNDDLVAVTLTTQHGSRVALMPIENSEARWIWKKMQKIHKHLQSNPECFP